jgi:hypothetical protein
MEASSSITSVLMGESLLSQFLLALVIVTLVYFLFLSVEYIYVSFLNVGNHVVDLFPYTASATDKQIVVRQDITKFPDAKVIPFSDNERTGIEFTYSFFLYVNSATFTGDDMLATVFYKGYATPYPLLGPGVFIRKNTNTLRVFMNAYKNPHTYCDVENIPVNKWFSCALVMRKNGLEVYVNGNLSKKLNFENTLPYQNFQDLLLFSQNNFVVRGSTTPAVGENETFNVQGSFSGNLSALKYYSYALSYTELQSMVNMGPSKKVMAASQDMPPYLADTWWTTSYTHTT